VQVLVTGGAGFIGSHLVDRLVTEGYDVVVLDNLSSGSLNNIKSHIEAGNIVFVNGDLKERHVVEDVVQGIDVVFHFAANPEVRVSTTNPEVHFRENVVATFNLLEAMRIKNVKEIVFASSSSVYGEPEVIPVDEDYPVRPVSVYGASKASCEALIHAYSKLYGIKAVVLRYANVVGPRMRHGVIYDLLMKLRENKSALEVLGDGFQVRSYLHVKDAVEATLIAWRKSSETYQVYNVGNTDWITVRELVEILLETLGLKGKVEVRYKPILHGVGWPGDVKKIALNSQKLMSLGWSPSMSSREAVVETVKALVSELHLKF
jgi:UDP-glucose 4-epimerase